MKTPLSDFLDSYAASGPVRMHMPGHKGKLDPFDLTEVPGADSLYEAQGVIAQSEQAMAACYGALETAYSAGGSTLCIQAMLAMAAGPGQRILCSRNLHVAAANAMALLDLRPEFLYGDEDPSLSQDSRLPPLLTGPAVAAGVNRWPDAAAVYVTCPDYFGGLSELQAIAAVCRGKGVPLLVDNAHGAHLSFLERNRHPIGLGASLCCDSFHKTLPALTGAAALHVGDSRFVGRAKAAMRLFGSTSPSYLILRSIDRLLPLLSSSEIRARLDLLASRCRYAEEAFLAQGISSLSGPWRDPCRMVLDAASAGLSGFALSEALERGGIVSEYADPCFVVLLPSVESTAEDFDRLLSFAQKALPKLERNGAFPSPVPSLLFRPERAMTMRQASLSFREQLAPQQAVGRVAACSASPCPPGVPVVLAGERIDQAAASLLVRRGFSTIEVVASRPDPS